MIHLSAPASRRCLPPAFFLSRLLACCGVLLMLLWMSGAHAQSTFSNLVYSPTSGLIPSDGTMTVTVTGTVRSSVSQDAVRDVRLMEGGTALAGQAYVVTYTNNGEVPVNTTRTIRLTAALPVGVHTLRLYSFTDNGTDTYSPEVVVTVNAQVNNADFISQSVPTDMIAGQSYNVSVTMQNNGSTTWLPGDVRPYRLGSENLQNNMRWGLNRVTLPTAVAPGASVTFNFTVTAPPDAGRHSFRWGMLREEVAWFGELNDDVFVNVALPTGPPTAAFGSPAEGASFTASGATATATFTGTATAGANAALTSLQLLENGAVFGSTAGASLTASKALSPGPHTIELRATNNAGKTVSVYRNVTVNSAQIPVPTLSSPAPSAYYVALPTTAAVPIAGTAAATGNGSPIQTIELLDRGTVIGTKSAVAQYTDTANLAPGLHALSLRATYVSGATVTSAVVNIEVLNQVQGNGAKFVSQVVPTTMRATQPYTVTVRMLNTGTTTWSEAASAPNGYRLGSQSPQDNRIWNGRVFLTGNVAPGQTAVFTFETVGPEKAATYAFQWQMVQEGRAWFGQMTDKVDIAVAAGAGPTATLVGSPTNVRVGSDGKTTINFTGNGQQSGTTIGKLELLLDAGTGYAAAPVASVTGSTATLSLSAAQTLPAGVYFYKLRATNAAGVRTDSRPVIINVVNSALLGGIGGVRTDAAGKPLFVGWACQPGNAAGLNYQLLLDAPTMSSGATLLTSGVANLTSESDNASVQSQCATPGAGHHFNIDLSAYTAQYAGRAMYVRAIVGTTGPEVVLPCDDTRCTMPGSLRIALSTPTDGQQFGAPATVFVRTQLSGGAGPYDEVAISVDGVWTVANADGAIGAYSITKTGLAARAAPYPVMARVRQGNTTIFSQANMITVVAASTTTVTLTAPFNGSVVSAGGSLDLAAVTAGNNPAASSVKFYAGTQLIATATKGASDWTAKWVSPAAGTYSISASAFDGAGTLITKSGTVSIVVQPAGAGNSSPTPLAVAITPPHLSGVDAGTLPGELGIDNGGAATYGIPIVVPPGTAGVQPALSLNYSSQATNGIVGLGWSVSGMSRILRCGQTIAQDNINSRINFSLTDRLCLDGQRLVLVNLPMNDANYWSDTAEYRTEIDGFSRISAQGVSGGDLAKRSFKVMGKDGKIMTYGGTVSSVIKAIVKPVNAGFAVCSNGVPCTPAAKSGPLGWAIDSTKDRYGNYINYNYTQSEAGEHVLTDMRYGGKGLAPHASVVFTMEGRPDAWKRYVDEARNDLRLRVRNISTYVGDDLSASATGGTRIRSYSLTYERSPTSGRSLLNAVAVVARNPQTGVDDVLPPTTFSWGKPDPNKQAGFEAPVPFPGGPRLSQLGSFSGTTVNKMHPELFAFLDFENHGYTDILEKSSAPLHVPRADLPFYLDRSFKTSYRYFHNNDGKGFVEYRYALNTGSAFGVLDIADFNGDGAPDLLVSATLSGKLEICLSPMGTGASLGSPGTTIIFTCRADMPTTGGSAPEHTPYITDVRGDGRSAIYGRTTPGGTAIFCMQTQCQTVNDPPGAVIGFTYAADGSPEFSRHDYATFAANVDYGGVGKPYDTRFTSPYHQSFIMVDNSPVEVYRWVNMRPTISMLTLDVPGAPVGSGFVADYTYREYVPIGPTRPPNIDLRTPYAFEKDAAGLGRDGDFNGSGYSSLAFGFREHLWSASGLNYSKAEMTLCLSTGRSLDCGVRKKYSGTAVAEFDGAGTGARLQHLNVLGVGNFIGDGQPNILANGMTQQAGGPFPTGKLYVCRVMGDDVSTAADGSDDSNIDCKPWAGTMRSQGTGDHSFFTDVLGTGRTQLVNYHEDWQSSQPNSISFGWTVAKPVDVAVAGQALDRIHSVTNGLKAVSRVTYTDGRVDGTVQHTGTVALSYPQHLSGGVGKYATTLTTDNGVAQPLVRTYRFKDPAIDVQGRGSLGFGRVTVRDEQTLVQTDTDFNLVWPLTGTARKVVVSRNGATLSQTDNVVGVVAIAQANGVSTSFPTILQSVEQRWDLSGAPMMRTTTSGLAGGTSSVSYDQYGNLRSSRVVVEGGVPNVAFTTDVVNTYVTTDVDRLYLGLPDSTVTTKSQTSDGKSVARKVAFEYESTGKMKSQTVEPDVAAMRLKTTYGRDATFGVVTSEKLDWIQADTGSAVSRVNTTMTYDAKGRFPATVSNALLHKEQHTYDPGTGARLLVIDPNNLSTRWEVNGFGRVTRELRPDGNETRVYVKQCGADCPVANAVAAITDQFHGSERMAVPQVAYSDNVGHVVRKLTWGFDGAAIIANVTYNAIGLPYEEEVPHFGATGVLAMHREYDVLNRPVLVRTFREDGGNADTRTDYNGLKITLTNPNSQVKVENRDALGRVISAENMLTTPAKTVTTRFSYDPWNNLTQTIDPNGNVIKVTYDTLGRKIELADPDLGRIQYFVNPLGLTWKQVSPKQRAKAALPTPPPNPFTKFVYDSLHRMTDRLEDDLQSHWVYDTAVKGLGQLAEAYTGPAATKDYRRLHSYDQFGRPAQTVQQLYDGSYITSPTYDAWGRVVMMTYVRGADAAKEFAQRYNGFGYLARVERNGLVLWQATAMDASLRVTSSKLGNGVAQTATYNARTGRMVDALAALGGVVRVQESYGYDAIGNVLQRNQQWAATGFIESFAYDQLNRITLSRIGAADKVFTYDDVGNVKTKTGVGTGEYTYPAQGASAVRPHAVTSIAGVAGTFVYDDNGNLTSDPWRTVTWNNFDMPISIVKGTKSSKFIYGSEHQRTRQLRDDGTVTVYGGAQEVELDAAGKPAAIKTYWPMGIGLEIDRPGVATQLRWLHKDRLGSPIATTDAAGVVAEQLAYDAWGKRRLPDGSATPDNLDRATDNKGFTGHEMLDQLELVHMNGRVYDPLTAKFLSADPFIQDPTNGQNYSRYTYVLNNPTNLTDPTGFQFTECTGSKLCTGGGSATGASVTCEGACGPSDRGGGNKEGAGSAKGSGVVKDSNGSDRNPVKTTNAATATGGAAANNVGVNNPGRPESSENYSPPGQGFFTPRYDPDDYPGKNIVQVVITAKKLISDTWDLAVGERVSAKESFRENWYAYLGLAMQLRGMGSTAAPNYYRGAKPGTNPSFTPRTGDYKIDPVTGFVKDTHGVSVFDNASSVSSKGFVPHQIDMSSVPETLRVIQRGADPRHFEFVPRPGANLTPDQFIRACSSIVCK